MKLFKFYSMSIFLGLTLLVGCPDDDSDDGAGGAVGMGGGGAVGMGGGGAVGMGGGGAVGMGGQTCGEASGPPITPETLPDGTVDQAYTQDLEALGGSQDGLVWTIESGALPAGLALDGDTGTIAGVPTEDGMFTFGVMVTVPAEGSPCPVQPGSQEYDVTIQPAG